MSGKHTGFCRVCGVKILPAWVCCRDHSKKVVLLELDTKNMEYKNKKEIALEKNVEQLKKTNDMLIKDLSELKTQYEKLQDNYQALAAFKMEKLLGIIDKPKRKGLV